MEKNVYVYVLRGDVVEYDYAILGVFTSYEKAEQHRKKFINENTDLINEVMNEYYGEHCLLIEEEILN